ncbi:MFS transporter [Galbibacter sp. BG1]|uniref:MFS transporter n=1 Tax=Galbibacter sp. BG1 TaxID=1170699 RepID=UPI0015BA9347|nr:MFS transporter [Galbibacter sp. BG1]QLE01357.1 MFS transporter [Galbibacter sp. BG1]
MEENINKQQLFIGSCIALVVTSMTFAIRAKLEMVFGPAGVGLSLEQIGTAFAPAFWGFTLAMIFGGPLVDSLGIKRISWIAFVTHAIGITLTIMANDMNSLFIATLFVGIGNGMVEAAFNPMIASMFPTKKTKMLNRFHVWFPGGIVIGSILGWLVMDVMGLSWQIMVGLLYIPVIIYGLIFWGKKFPVTERVQMGGSFGNMVRNLGKPLFIFMVVCMLMTAASELGTTQRIESLLHNSVAYPLLVLAFINGIMALGRAFAGQVIHKLQPAGMLLFSAIFTFIGLWLLTITSGGFTFAAAAVFAIGVTFFWPTMIGFVAEYLPETGALGLSIMGGAGMLSVSLVLPIMGRLMDTANATEALRTMSILPAILIIAFLGLNIYMRKKYKTPLVQNN